METKSRMAAAYDPAFTELKSGDLQCRDCIYVLEHKTRECGKYIEKPGYVIYASKDCPHHRTSEQNE